MVRSGSVKRNAEKVGVWRCTASTKGTGGDRDRRDGTKGQRVTGKWEKKNRGQSVRPATTIDIVMGVCLACRTNMTNHMLISAPIYLIRYLRTSTTFGVGVARVSDLGIIRLQPVQRAYIAYRPTDR